MSYKFLCCCLLVVFNSCSPSGTSEKNNATLPARPASVQMKKYIEIIKPAEQPQYMLGNPVHIPFKIIKKNTNIDSIVLTTEKSVLPVLESTNEQVVTKLENCKLGQNSIKVGFYFNDSLKENHYYQVIVLSDIVPEKYTYKIIHTYKHDITSFTQGLVYENGLMYEGTGRTRESKLFKYIPGKDQAISTLRLKDDLFGEGIAIFDDKIIQLTWRSNVGFIYDKNSFNLIQKIYYDSKEGWGITYDGEKLIMSDGSHTIYFLDKEYFTETGSIEVYDNKGPVKSLNELEYVNGELYANIWTTDEIVVINPKTGAVTKRIDMSGLLSASDKHENIDVLNGIAYNPEKDIFYVTGKYWPKLFEVTFMPK